MTDRPRTVGDLKEDDRDTSDRDQSQAGRRVASIMTNAAGNAAAAIDNSRSTAADGLEAAATALHDRANDLSGGDAVRKVARTTADGLSSTADYVRSHDAKRMMADLETFVKGNPGPALAVAAAFGFLLGRALSRD